MALKLTRNRVLAGAGAIAAATVTGVMLSLSPSGIINTRTGTGFGSDLQAAINAAQTGDVLQLNGTEAVCNCTENKGLVIEGPGVIKTANTQWALYYPPRTPKATLRNLTVTVTIGGVNDIIRHGNGDGPKDATQDSLDEVPQGLTLENVDVTGLPGLEIKRGITANGANLVIRNSKIREIHGKGYDTQAVCGWNGPGPVLIEDSYLEAAGENVMFGGADPSIPNLVPSDITIRRSHFFKPLSWKGVWTVKNLFETKNARRVLLDGNVFENVWPDAQVGFAILIKSNNQDSTAPWSITEDLTFTNNKIVNAEHGLNILGVEYPPKVSGVTKRIRISNNFWDVKRIWLQVIRGGEDITLDHNTYISATSGEFTQISFDEIPVRGFVLNNNLGNKVGYGIKGSGSSEGKPTLDTWCPGWAMAGNVMTGTGMQVYPTGNNYPASLAEVGFVDTAAGNYRLAASSPYKGKATDGKDPGVDWDILEAAHRKPSGSPAPTPSQSVQPSPSATSSSESPHNTRVPTASQITDNTNAVWTLSNGKVFRNGTNTGGLGSPLVYCDRVVYVLGLDNRWWRWNGSWAPVGVSDPCSGASPSPTGTTTPQASPSPTSSVQPLPSPSPSPSPVASPRPSPSPALPICTSNQAIGNPAKCLCTTGVRCTGSNARCL